MFNKASKANEADNTAKAKGDSSYISGRESRRINAKYTPIFGVFSTHTHEIR